MSASGLANEAVNQLRIAQAKAPAPAPTENAAALDNAISALATYIPAEAMALYLALTSSLPVIAKEYPLFAPANVYWVFVFFFSPALFLLAYFVKLAKSDASWPEAHELPYFRVISSIIAFAVWGLCVPGNPFSSSDHSGRGVLFGIMATLVSIVLPSVEAIYNWVMGLKQRGGKGQAANAGGNATGTAPTKAGSVDGRNANTLLDPEKK